MAQTPSDQELDREVDGILNELLPIAIRAAGPNVVSGIEAWWRSHYHAKFFYAIRMRGRTYAADKDKLMQKAEELGTVARKLAGNDPVTTEHAARASFDVDCQTSIYEAWCN